MLKVQNICKVFNAGTVNEKVAINDLSLELKKGDFVKGKVKQILENKPFMCICSPH